MLESFLNFETTNDLFSLKVSGVQIWPIVRIDIYNEINMQKKIYSKPHNTSFKEYSLKHILMKFRQIKYAFLKNPYIKLKPKDVLIINHPRRVLNDGLYRCLYTSDLADKLNGEYLMIENSYNLTHYTPIPENHIIYSDLINLKYHFYFAMRKIFKISNLSKNDKRILKKLFSEINKEFKVNLDIENMCNKIDKVLTLYNVNYKSYKKIITKINPKVIVEVVSYANNLYEINKVAKEKSIPTIELQHGTMGKHHIAYNYHEKRTIDTFPDYIFTYGDYWKNNTRFPIDQNKVRSVGWPYYENKVNKIKLQHKTKNIILFISQGTIGKELSKIAVELFNSIDLDRYQIIYKLHPGEYEIWKEKYPWLLKTCIQVVDDNTHDMHYFLRQSDIQIGVNSTAIFEGLGYGLKTIIFKLYGYQYMEDLYSNNYVSLVSTSDQLLNEITKSKQDEIILDQEYFWKSNSLNNLLIEINNIIKKNK